MSQYSIGSGSGLDVSADKNDIQFEESKQNINFNTIMPMG